MTHEDSSPKYAPLMIRDMEPNERPRERMERVGASALSNSELLAIILRTGIAGESVLQLAQRLLSQYQGFPGLARASFLQLAKERGVGVAKAAQIHAALEIGRRVQAASPDSRPQIRSPADIANLLMPQMGLLEQEHLRVMVLDTKHYVISSPTVYIGNVNTSVIRIAEVFREGVRLNCAAIAIAHNHPSGDPTPSSDDVSVTEQIVRAGKLLDIEVLDHLVIGRQRYVSLKERGLGFG